MGEMLGQLALHQKSQLCVSPRQAEWRPRGSIYTTGIGRRYNPGRLSGEPVVNHLPVLRDL